MSNRRWCGCDAIALALLSTIVGCGAKPVFSVRGKVLVDGRPTEGVYVVLTPAGGDSASSVSRTGGDGGFQLMAPASGSYALTSFWPSQQLDEGAIVEGPDRLGGRYRGVSNPVATIEVHEGENVIEPLKLQSR